MFHWLLGWYCSYCGAQLDTVTSERKHNETSQPSGRHTVYIAHTHLSQQSESWFIHSLSRWCATCGKVINMTLTFFFEETPQKLMRILTNDIGPYRFTSGIHFTYHAFLCWKYFLFLSGKSHLSVSTRPNRFRNLLRDRLKLALEQA